MTFTYTNSIELALWVLLALSSFSVIRNARWLRKTKSESVSTHAVKGDDGEVRETHVYNSAKTLDYDYAIRSFNWSVFATCSTAVGLVAIYFF